MKEQLMKRALDLSKKGAGCTCPNPMVGAVIEKNGLIIGEGWHHGPGLPHAEVEALCNCTQDPKGATMYVTLEPCNHYGKTPPCTEAIIKAGIAKVIFAVNDPNPKAKGGAERLREAGIEVETGIRKAEAIELNRKFLYHCLTRRPWVILKAAMSLDAKITSANGESKWITGVKSRQKVHQLRAEVSAVLVGSGTVLQDDPLLTVRLTKQPQRQPYRVVLDSQLNIPITSKMLSGDPGSVIVFCTADAPVEKEKQLVKLGAKVIRQPRPGRVDLNAALITLGEFGIQSILVEGGTQVFTSFIEEKLVNEYFLFYAPFFIGGSTATNVMGGTGIFSLKDAEHLEVKSIKKSGQDFLVHAYKEAIVRCLPV